MDEIVMQCNAELHVQMVLCNEVNVEQVSDSALSPGEGSVCGKGGDPLGRLRGGVRQPQRLTFLPIFMF